MGTMKVIIPTVLLLLSTVVGMMPRHEVETINATKRDIRYRLPKIVRPISYEVTLRVDLLNSFEFDGNVRIKVTVTEETQTIILHSKSLAISKIEVLDGTTLLHETREPNLDETYELLTIQSEEALVINREYDIYIEFEASLSRNMLGFYRSSYTTSEGEVRWLATTQFQPTYARTAFPCFDEPEFKAKFTININTPPGFHSLSNMPSNDPEVGEDGWKLYKFQETQVMSTYLVAFVVSDFESRTNEQAKYHFSAWAHRDIINHSTYSQEVGPKLVDYFEAYTEIEYTFPKIDQVAVPDFAFGAMENWGLITYRESALLFHEGISTEASRKNIAFTVAHELAHMWFGNLVTLDWWEHTWLNEGFAHYFHYFATAAVETSWNFMDQFVIDTQQAIYATDALTSAQALSSECYSPAQIMAKFNMISYSKGASIIRMLSHILTPDTFQKGLQKYLNDHKYGNTVPIDLFNALEETRLEDKVGIFRTHDFLEPWTTQPGFPVINVKRDGKYIVIRQKRFLQKGTEEGENLKWWVPLTWTTQSQAPQGFDSTQPKRWIIPNDTSLMIETDAEETEWIIFNNQETGYYRVNYDEDSWRLIIQGLIEEHDKIHLLNRAQLLDDALNLARASKLNYSTALEMTEYLTNETEYVPWAAALNALAFLNRRLIGLEDYDYFKDYISDILTNIYEKLGFEEKLNEIQTTRLHRVNVLNWACQFEIGDCVNKSREMFQQFHENPTGNAIPANLRALVFCIALRYEGKEEWDYLWELYQESTFPTEKLTLLLVLGCTNVEAILNNYLQMSITENSGIKRQDAANVFVAVCNNPAGVEIAFKFLRENFMQITNFYGTMNAVANFIVIVASSSISEEQVNQLEQFIAENANYLGPVAEVGRNAIESARADLEWINIHKTAIVNWLKERDATDSTDPTDATDATDSPTSTDPPGPTESPGGGATICGFTILILSALSMVLFLQRV